METYRGYVIAEANGQWTVYGKANRTLFSADTAEECMNEIDRQKKLDFIAAWKAVQYDGLWRYAARQSGQPV